MLAHEIDGPNDPKDPKHTMVMKQNEGFMCVT